MSFNQTKTQIITGPGVLSLQDPNAIVAGPYEVYESVGEIGDEGIKLTIKPIKVERRLDSGSVVKRIASYDLTMECVVLNTGNSNFTEADLLANREWDIKAEQTPDGAATPRVSEVLSADLVSVEIDTTIGSKQFSEFKITVEKSGLTLADVLTITDHT